MWQQRVVLDIKQPGGRVRALDVTAEPVEVGYLIAMQRAVGDSSVRLACFLDTIEQARQVAGGQRLIVKRLQPATRARPPQRC